jgi:hypothetical protein
MDTAMSRRGVLAGLGAAGAAAGFGAVASEAEAAAPTVRGTWLIKPTTSGGPAGFQALAAFAAGGVFVTTGSDEAGTGLGEWNARGAHGFGFTYLNFHFDTGGHHSNTVKVRAAGTFHGSHLSGHATLTALDASGNRLGADSRFTFSGRRVSVEAP